MSRKHVEHIRRAVKILGSQVELAEACGVRQSHVSNWICRDKTIPLERALAIEIATDGEVTMQQLRPDLFKKLRSNAAKIKARST